MRIEQNRNHPQLTNFKPKVIIYPHTQTDSIQVNSLNVPIPAQEKSEEPSVHFDLLYFISNLTLPQSLLGQGFFPRRYHVLYAIHKVKLHDLDFEFVNLVPDLESMPYLDNMIKQTLLKKLSMVDQLDLKEYLLREMKGKNSKIFLFNGHNTLDILIEFKEKNE